MTSQTNEGGSPKDNDEGVPGITPSGFAWLRSETDTPSASLPIPHAKEERGLDLTVYAIRKGRVYAVDPDGQKYKMPLLPKLPYHIGMRMTNVKFSKQ